MAQIDSRLEEMSDDLLHKLTCPSCGGDLGRMDIIEILSADALEKKTKETYKNTVGGAVGGATIGAIAGPPGVVAGAVLGSIAGGSRGQKKDELRRVHVNCSHCGHHGAAH